MTKLYLILSLAIVAIVAQNFDRGTHHYAQNYDRGTHHYAQNYDRGTGHPA